MPAGRRKLLRLEAALSLQLVVFVATVGLCLGYAFVVLRDAVALFDQSRQHSESTLARVDLAINRLQPMRIAMINTRNDADEFTHRFRLLTLDPDYDAELVVPIHQQLRIHRAILDSYREFLPDEHGAEVLENLDILIDVAEELLVTNSANMRQQLFRDTIQPMEQIEHAIEAVVKALQEREQQMRAQLAAGMEVTEQSQARFQRDVARLQQVFAGTILVIVVLPVLIQYQFFRSLRRRLSMLERYARDIAQEHYELPPFRSRDSTGRLAVRLNLMGRQIRRLLRSSRAQRARADRALETVENLAYFDPLTGLENRRRFYTHLEEAIRLYQKSAPPIAILFIDLDNFKIINDSMGHVVGDQLLKVVAERLSKEVRARDNLARLGGDEFAILAYHQADHGSRLLERIQQSICQPVFIDEHEVFTTISTGVTLIDDSTLTPDDLLRRADMAMYQAKSSGRNTFQRFDNELQRRVDEQLNISREIRTAIREQQFLLHFQPQYELASGRMTGVEALIRWPHPQQGMMRPDLFIPVAEKTGLITQIDEWVVENACQAAAAYRTQCGPLRMAINVSPNQFHNPEFVAMVEGALARARLPAELLEIEVTEGVLLSDLKHAVSILNQLRELGIKTALDDFGTGYSSLNYLKQLPLDVLKIDRSFISNMQDYKKDRAIVKTIIDLGRHLDLEVIAEGIESELEMNFLRDNGCDTGQGFYFARPAPLEALLGAGQRQAAEQPTDPS